MRSTIHKQNSPPRRTSLIKRYCLAAAVLLGLVGPPAEIARGDFILQDDEQLTVSSPHYQGYLYDRSRVSIVSGGSVTILSAYDSSTVNISAGSVDYLGAYASSTATISGGYVQGLNAFDWSTMNITGVSVPYGGGSVPSSLSARNSSTVNISGGSFSALHAYDSSTVNISAGSVSGNLGASGLSNVAISGGSVSGYLVGENSSILDISGGSVSGILYARDSTTANISGGSMSSLYASGSSTANISGGFISSLLVPSGSSTVDISGGSISGGLFAQDSSTVTFHGLDFRVVGGLVFDGDYVLGTGLLGGKWFDGTLWAVQIDRNSSEATILAIPQSVQNPSCVGYPAMDFNGDCKVDFSDLAIFLTQWLECNLDPPSACWE